MQDLLLKYFNGKITAEEKKQLLSLVESDVKFREEFLSMMNLKAISGWLPQDGDMPNSIVHLLQFKQNHKTKNNILVLRHLVGYAAAICVAVLCTWFVMRKSDKLPEKEKPTVYYEEYSTPSGQRAKLKLHDGTVVWLNARSVLRCPNQFDSKERHVKLEGEAYFEVAKNPECPFVVETEKANVKALGTKFNVFAYKERNEFSTSLLEGIVDVYNSDNKDNALRLQPNEQVDFSDGKWTRNNFKNTDFLLWKDGIYAFDNVTFRELVRKLELYYDITIVVNNHKLSNYKFSGKFRQRDGVESVLRTLQKVRYFKFIKDKDLNKITIS